MIEQIKPEKRYLLAQKEDLNLNITLKQNFNDLNEFNNTRLISLSELFTKERNESIKYRIYGNINYFSFLRNKKINPSNITDMFNDDYLSTGFNLEDFFDIKLFRLLTNQSYQNQTTNYVEELTSITKNTDYKLNFFGYTKNIYNEKIYNFKFDTMDINPYELKKINNDLILDNSVYIGFIPKQSSSYDIYEKIIDTDNIITSLDLNTKYGYVESSYTQNLNDIVQLVNANTQFSNTQFKSYFEPSLKNMFKILDIDVSINNINLNIRFIKNYIGIGNGDYKTKSILNLTQNTFKGNFISFDKENYLFSELQKKEYILILKYVDKYTGVPQDFQNYINTNYPSFTYTSSSTDYTISIDFSFKFNPFYKIELKKYDPIINEIYSGISTTLIPPRTAIVIDNKTIWKDLLEYGDPDNYDNPFINGTHYFFNDINFQLKPDLSDKNTTLLVNEFTINFTNNDFKFNKNNITITPKNKKQTCC
jgi:hypothetical protein